jgi:hypothetical protein
MWFSGSEFASSTCLGLSEMNESLRNHIADLYGPFLPFLPHPLGGIASWVGAGAGTGTLDPSDISSAVPPFAGTTTDAAGGLAAGGLAAEGLATGGSATGGLAGTEGAAAGSPAEVEADVYAAPGKADSPINTAPPPGATDATLEGAAAVA